jgi:hypothetical protein
MLVLLAVVFAADVGVSIVALSFARAAAIGDASNRGPGR